MSDRTMNLAIIGAGRIAQVHAAAAARDARISLVCVADIVEAAARALAASHGARVVDADAIFSDDGIDAVLIASSTDTHADYLEKAARSGKAILCEKPIALDLDRTRAAVATVE